MPRACRDSDDEVESKPAARRTRASSAATPSSSVTDSPAKRSTRSVKHLATIDSSPEGADENSSQPTVRKTRSRAGTLDKTTTLSTRSLRPRKRSVSSDRSQSVDMESETTQRRLTRKAASAAPGTPTKPNLRTRSVRAGSEAKSTPPPTQAKRVTRASSVDPVGKNEESASTPVKRRTRASMVPAVPTLTEEQEAQKKAARSLNNTVIEIDDSDASTSTRPKYDSKRRVSKLVKENLDAITVEEPLNDSQKPLLDSSRKNEETCHNSLCEPTEIDDKTISSLKCIDSAVGLSETVEDSNLSKHNCIVIDSNSTHPENLNMKEKSIELASSVNEPETRANSKKFDCDEIQVIPGSLPDSFNCSKLPVLDHDKIVENPSKNDALKPVLVSDEIKVGENMVNEELKNVDNVCPKVVKSNFDGNNFDVLMKGKTAVVLLKDVIKEAHEIALENCKNGDISKSLDNSCEEINPQNQLPFNSANVSDDSGNVSPTIIVPDDEDDDDDCHNKSKRDESAEDIGPMNSTMPIDAHNQLMEEPSSLTNKQHSETSIVANRVAVDSEVKSFLTKNNTTKDEVKKVLCSDDNGMNACVEVDCQDVASSSKFTNNDRELLADYSTTSNIPEKSNEIGASGLIDQSNTVDQIPSVESMDIDSSFSIKHLEPIDVDLPFSKNDEKNCPNNSNVTEIDTNQNNSQATESGKDTIFSAVPDTDGEDVSSSDPKKQSIVTNDKAHSPKKSAGKKIERGKEKMRAVAGNTDSEDNVDDLFQDIPAEEWIANKPNDSANRSRSSQNEADIESTVSIHKDDGSLDESHIEDPDKTKNTRLSLDKREVNESLEQTASVGDDRSDESPEKTAKSPEKQRRFSKELKVKLSSDINNFGTKGSERKNSESNEESCKTKKRQSLRNSPNKFAAGEEKNADVDDSLSSKSGSKHRKKLVRGQNVDDSSHECVEIDAECSGRKSNKTPGDASLNASLKSVDRRRSSLSNLNSDFSLRLAPTESLTNSPRKSSTDKNMNNSTTHDKDQPELIKSHVNEEQNDSALKKSRKSGEFMNQSSQSPLTSDVNRKSTKKMSTSLDDSKKSIRNSLSKEMIESSSEDENDTNNKENKKSLNRSGKIDDSDEKKLLLQKKSEEKTPSKSESSNTTLLKSVKESVDLSHIVDEDSSNDENDSDNKNVKSTVSNANKSLNKSRKSIDSLKVDVDIVQEINDTANLDVSPKKQKIPADQIESSKSVRRSIEAMKNTNPRKHDFSTIAEVGSSSDEYELPNFLNKDTSGDEDESEDSKDEDEDESKSIDSDTAKELNLAGKDITKYSDDDVPGDDCRASEEEVSDSEDDGSDLGDFVVPDGEEEDSDSDDEEGEYGELNFSSGSDADEVIATIKAAGPKFLNESKTLKNKSLNESKSTNNKNLEVAEILANVSQDSSSGSDDENVPNVADKIPLKNESLDRSKDVSKNRNHANSKSNVEMAQNSSVESEDDTTKGILNQSNAKNKSMNNSQLLKNTKSKISNSLNQSLNISGKNKVANVSLLQKSNAASSDDSEEESRGKNIVLKSEKNTSLTQNKNNTSLGSAVMQGPFTVDLPSSYETSSGESDEAATSHVARSKNPSLKVEPPSSESESEAENGEDSYQVIVAKPEDKSHILSTKGKKLIECSTPKSGITKKGDFPKTSESFIEKPSTVAADKSNPSGRKSEGTINLSDTKIMSKSILGSSKTHDNSVKFKEIAEIVTPEAEPLDNRKPWKLVPLNQTAYPSSAETPDTRFLKKAKLNESYPILESMKSNEFDELMKSTKIEGKKNKSSPAQSSQEAHDDEVPPSSKKSKKRKMKDLSMVQSAEEDIDTSTIKKTKKRPRVEESSLQETGDSSNNKDQEDKSDADEQEIAHLDDSEFKNGLEPLVHVKSEKKSKKSKKQPAPSANSSDDEAPESVGFNEARRLALESMQQLREGFNAQKQARKKKQSEHAERMLKEKLDAEERRMSLKRLPDDLLDQLGDTPFEDRRPIKRQKLTITKEKKQLSLIPSFSMFTPNTMVPPNLRVDNVFRPLLSQAGSTTQFGVFNLSKVKKIVKKSERAVQFRDKFLSRNPRQPMSAYNAYLLKQKAKGGL
ncbi:hypothetical protein QAD02_005565 [Eretmocerus hayati]|uniref:Uncharacterized protein n=1 Tax=Eretmocerus hayati TaxID=131215 RepID=A0ACC2NSV4_9HYME|nr:hypothetical protein QAD02_005565 [Eretmocerus hayati]